MQVRHILTFGVGSIGVALIGLVSVPVMSWYFTAEEIGRFAMLQIGVNLALLVFSLGLDQAYVREFYEYHDHGELLKVAVLPGLVVLVACLTIVVAVFPRQVSGLAFGVQEPFLAALLAASVLAAFLSRFLSLILRMQQRSLAYSISQLLPKGLLLSLLFVPALHWMEVGGLIIAQTITIILATAIFSINTLSAWRPALAADFRLSLLGPLLRYGAPLAVSGAATWLLVSVDRIALRHLSDFEQLGVYSVAASFAGAALIIQGIFSLAWAPSVYKWVKDGARGRFVEEVSEHVLALAALAFAISGSLSWILSYILPPTYRLVPQLLTACMAYPLFYLISETTAVGLNILRRTSYSMLCAILAAVFNVAGCYLLVSKYGAQGAAISTAISSWFFLVARTEFSNRMWRRRERTRLYTVTGTALLMCCIHAGSGSMIGRLMPEMWLVFGAVMLWTFRRSIILTWNIVRR